MGVAAEIVGIPGLHGGLYLRQPIRETVRKLVDHFKEKCIVSSKTHHGRADVDRKPGLRCGGCQLMGRGWYAGSCLLSLLSKESRPGC